MPRKTNPTTPAKTVNKTVKPAPEADAGDHREHYRYTFRGRANAVIFPKPGGPGIAEEWEVVTTDLSRGGVSIMHRKPLETGQQVMLVLNDDKRFVEVCWCCQVWPGLFAAGCRFLEQPDGSLMNYLLAADDR